MCITGNFALTMALDPHLVAPVLAEPSVPLMRAGGVHASPETLKELRRRRDGEGLTVLGLRFHGDKFCQKACFDALKLELGDGFERLELPAAATPNPHPHTCSPANGLTKRATRPAPRWTGFWVSAPSGYTD